MTDHLVIPDTHVSPGVSTDHLEALGKLIVERKPDVIVHLGDHADMNSLCAYNNRLQFEGARYQEDIQAANDGMDRLLGPLEQYNHHRRRLKMAQYLPRMVLTLGNHEHRITRLVENDPRLLGAIDLTDLDYRDWEVIPFLEPVIIDGVTYVHYVKQDRSPNPIPRAHLIAQRRFSSFTCGHTQGLDYFLSHGLHRGERRIQCIVAGSFYMHDEDYLGPQGSQHWRGVIYKHNVHDGEYDTEFISLNRLMENYS